jgi:tRNA(fMet)-specific endonuclease VapC
VRYLIDTDWLIDALLGLPTAVRALDRHRNDGLGVSIISAGEVYEGAFVAPDPPTRLATYRQFLSAFATVPLSHPVMERFAGLRAQLRSQGNLIPDLDLLSASTALEHDLTILTRNITHFARIPHLELYEHN